MNIVWDGEFELISPTLGTLLLNHEYPDGRIYRLNPKRCVGRRGVRANNDNVPQGDGEIFHTRFATGSEMQLAIQLWDGQEIACDEMLVTMYDELRGWLWSLLRPPDDGGRIVWTPDGKAARLLDALRLREIQDPEEDQETQATEILVLLDSPFPYAISLTETVTSADATLTNAGNVDFYPVFKVYGPTGAWSIQNNSTGEIYLYDSSRPGGQAIGGGEYAEIDMFRGGLIYLNGDQDNLKPNVDVEASDILTIAPGGVSYSVFGATADVLMHDAWA